MNLIEIGINEVSGRKISILELESVNEFPESVDLKSTYFGCFLGIDLKSSNGAEISEFAVKLLNLGVSFCSCWGTNCETTHDLVDSVCHKFLPNPTDQNVIMTTWLTKENLAEALWDHLYVSFPAEDYWDGTKLDMFVFVNKNKSFDLARVYLSDLKYLNQIVVGDD